MCHKQQHISPFGAQQQALSLAKDKGMELNKMRIYKCRCGCYHATKWSKEEYAKSKLKNENNSYVNKNSGPSYHRVIMPLMLMCGVDMFAINSLQLVALRGLRYFYVQPYPT